DANPASHLAAHHAKFLAGAIARVQLILQRLRSEAELEAWSGAECRRFYLCLFIQVQLKNAHMKK
ncbi:MAG: hypothetical protein KAT65_22255, partial [Methanophagales archaeon]|nr:hypothetical protein [Methanophagales archaeon]